MIIMQGEIKGRYRIINQIGGGAMASIYRARDENLKRDVAIKILHSHLTEKEEHIQRFVREAHALAQLPHPNIVQIYDFGNEGGLYFIVSEFVDGKDLSQILKVQDPFPVSVATIIVIQLLEAINYAHKHGIIHRDIKLENVILGSDGSVKLTDFGIAHIFEWDKMTLPGALIGSPYYMAPEIIEGKPAKAESDIFSAGVLFYRLLTGRFPFPGNNPAQVLKSILKDTPEPPHKLVKQVDRELSRYVLNCLNKRPDERPGAEEIRNDLVKYLEPLSIRDVSAELRDFYQKPEEYLKLRNEQFIQLLTESARKLVSLRNYAPAITLLNRAISAGAANREVTRLLNRAKFNMRLWIYPVILFTSAVILIAGFKLVERKEPDINLPTPVVVVKTENRGQKTEERRQGTEDRGQKAGERRQRTEARREIIKNEKTEPVVEEHEVKTGRLIIRTNPWADVYVDGRFYGRTPFLDVIEVTEGKHTIEAKNPFAESVKKEITIESDRTYIEHITLPLLPGTVDIVLNVDAQVYIDGKLIGEGHNFERLTLAQGRHTIRIEKNGYRSIEKTVDIEAAQAMNLKFDLVKESMIWKD